MSKYVKGFLIGIFGLAVVFVLTVLVMGSINGRNFSDEIKSWGDSKQEEVVEPEDDTLTEEGENSDAELENNVGNETQTTAVITIMSNNDFKIAL